jgi:V-type H+-transporting ATPase subunit C
VRRGEKFFFSGLTQAPAGTLDSLMSLMDDLNKHDGFVGGVCMKLGKQLVDFAVEREEEDQQGVDLSKLNLDEILMVGQAELDLWLKKFRWAEGRYDVQKSSLQSITEELVKVRKLCRVCRSFWLKRCPKTTSVVDVSLRQKMADWVSLNRSITSAKSIATGSVLMRDLAGVLKPEQVVDTESLETLLVVVQKSMMRDWLAWYETLEVEDLKQVMVESGAYASRVVMPRSSAQIAEDSDSALVSIVVLKRFSEQIRAKLRERKFMPREMNLEKAGGEGANKERSLAQLVDRRNAARIDLLKFCKTQFAEVFSCWVHLKVVRVWVESVVRFSLPANYEVYLIRPDKRYFEKIRKTLHDLFRELVAEGVLDSEKDEAPQGMPAFVSEDLYPYVQTELNVIGRAT